MHARACARAHTHTYTHARTHARVHTCARSCAADYHLLEEVQRADDIAKRCRPPYPKQELPPHLSTLVYQANRRHIDLRLMNPGVDQGGQNSANAAKHVMDLACPEFFVHRGGPAWRPEAGTWLSHFPTFPTRGKAEQRRVPLGWARASSTPCNIGTYPSSLGHSFDRRLLSIVRLPAPPTPP
eukprot:351274-Chlamydomonas_euryale.AAC.1